MAVLVVDACPDTDALLSDPSVDHAGLRVERVDDAAQAITRLETGELFDVVLLAPNLADPVRTAQRLHSLDRDGAIVILVTAEREAEVCHALSVAPFLEGDVECTRTGDTAEFAPALLDAARRSRARREEAAGPRRRRETPPPLSARYLGTLLDSAPIGIVTLGPGGAVIGWNRRTGEMLGEQEVDALGIPFAELWPQSERGRLERLIGSLESVGLGGAGETFERGDQAFEITGSRFQIRSGESGAILVLQDVTQRVAAERELRDTARTLQESLLPPHLPAMPRVELAAEFRPAGGGLEVGGDFYDMFEIAEDQWAIVIGDVCGKGAQAAALTALTRYTVRAAAMYEETAGGVLRVLNQALLRQQEDFTFTTLAYCQLDLRSEPSRLRVAVGGHPLPLLLRADGLAETVGRGGPLLGVLPGAEYADVEIAMQVGDMLVLYTDGLADARAPARLTTERDLLAELQRSRGLSAAQTVAQLEKFALAGSRETPRDDIAVIVAKVTM